jgi:hypothetical protein
MRRQLSAITRAAWDNQRQANLQRAPNILVTKTPHFITLLSWQKAVYESCFLWHNTEAFDINPSLIGGTKTLSTEKVETGSPKGWQNPITVSAGRTQKNVDPARLLPSRPDLMRTRLEFQRQLIRAGQQRFTPIQVNVEGVIYDGHQGVRAAAEEGRAIDVLVIDVAIAPVASSIFALSVR